MRTLALLLVAISSSAAALAACSTSSAGSGDAGASDSSSTETGPDAEPDSSADSTADSDAATDADAAPATDADAASDSDAAADSNAPTDANLPIYPDAGADCGIGDSGEPLDLACTGLYSDWSTKTVASGNQPYQPGYVLWSDGALKSRWIALPAGTQIDTSSMDDWTFPVDTRIWKEFSLVLTDGGAPTRIETRLLWKQAPGTWYRTTYRWSADGQTSATELRSGEMNVAGTTYEVPSSFECDECHNGRPDGVLGFEAVALSAASASGLTLSQLVAQNLVTTPPDGGSLAVPGDSTAQATLGWLHINCGVACHNDVGGLASNTGFLMRLKAASLASVQTTDTYMTGWNQQTQAFQIPDAATTYRFHACDLASSGAYYRADNRDGVNGIPQGVQMPPLVSHAIDDADMATLAAWINEGCGDAGATDGSSGD